MENKPGKFVVGLTIINVLVTIINIMLHVKKG